MSSPLITYIRAIFQPKRPINKTRATSLIMGEATKKEKVIPNGTPAWMNPKNKGMAEQEQNGVIIPKRAAKILPVYLFLWDKIFLIFSGGRYDLTKETTKIITNKSNIILMVSKIKKLTDSAKTVSDLILKTEYVSREAKSSIG